MSKRKFRKVSKDQANIIWQTVKRTPTGWKHISKAARLIGVSRQTVYDFLQRYPEPEKTRKLQPKYVEDFKQTEGYKKILRYNTVLRKIKKQTVRSRLSFAQKCWLFLNKRDPIGWTLADFRKLQNNPVWFDEELEPPQMPLTRLVMIRNFMEALGHHDWIREFPTKTSKRAKGRKRHWYLRHAEVDKIYRAIDEFGAKMLFIMACSTGNRISAYLNSTFADLHLDVQGWEIWSAYESKTKKHNDNELNADMVEVLKAYISRMKLAGRYGPEMKMFQRPKDFYVQQLRNGLKKAGLAGTCIHPKTKKRVDYCIHGMPISWHITRHTFASLLAQEGVELQYIMDQGPWSNAETLMEFYAGMDRRKIREGMSKLKLIK